MYYDYITYKKDNKLLDFYSLSSLYNSSSRRHPQAIQCGIIFVKCKSLPTKSKVLIAKLSRVWR